MNFNVFIPVRIISGVGCVKNNQDKLILGKKAFIVTGKSGAAKSGALDDVISVLDSNGIAWTHFNGCRENPLLTDCFEAGKMAAEFGADFIIAIGGGSAIDSAKAIAAFATNGGISAMDIFDEKKLANDPLALIAIPTTSGTGSEANGTAVMSLPDGVSKRSFGGERHWPCVSFLDPRYTYSLGHYSSVSCALDAFAHAMESYLSPKSTEVSRMFAVYAAKNIWEILRSEPKAFSENERAILQAASCAAGINISITGTGFPHPLGYSLTMLDGVPHGAACAVFYGEYIAYNMRSEEGRELIESFCENIGAEAEALATVLPKLANVDLSLDEDGIKKRVDLIVGAKNYVNSPYVLSDGEKYEIYKKLFLK